MTKKQLMKIITEVVRKEVKKEVQKIFIKEESSNKLAGRSQACARILAKVIRLKL